MMTLTEDQNEAFLTPEEAATHLSQVLGRRISVRTLRRWRAVGEGPPYIRCGQYTTYRQAALVDWLKSRETVPPRSSR